jgi:hypothetical protein
VNVADFRVTLDGQDISPKLQPRLVSLSISEKRGGEADQLDIVLDDSDGRLALPREGARLHVELGWRSGDDVEVGLVDKGDFVVDELEHSGPPDQVTIRARSADMTSAIRTRREGSWHDTTLGAVLQAIAGRNRLTLRCAPALASVAVPTLQQGRESDMALVRRLGREHDAVASVKRTTLVFAPIGGATTAGGKPLPALTIRRRDGDQHSFRIAKREESAGTIASWHDGATGRKKTVTVGKADGAKRLTRTYASEAEARTAATAAQGRAARQPLSLSMTLALGRADLSPECKATVEGYKAEIDKVKWIVAEVTHTLGDRGFTTAVKLETAP